MRISFCKVTTADEHVIGVVVAFESTTYAEVVFGGFICARYRSCHLVTLDDSALFLNYYIPTYPAVHQKSELSIVLTIVLSNCLMLADDGTNKFIRNKIYFILFYLTQP